MDEQYRKWYKTKRWRRLRRLVLDEHPMCQCPHCKGVDKQANVVDHIKPHRGDARLFWNRDNLQAMNKQCHDSYKQKLEGGRSAYNKPRYTKDGQPIDDEHHWNTE